MSYECRLQHKDVYMIGGPRALPPDKWGGGGGGLQELKGVNVNRDAPCYFQKQSKNHEKQIT